MTDLDLHEGLSRVIAQLTAAITNTSLYSSSHPQVAQYIAKAFAVLEEMFLQKQEVTILLVGDDLVADSRAFPAGSSYVRNFVRILKKKGIERLTFVSGLTSDELVDFIKNITSLESTSVLSSARIKLGKVEIRVLQHDARHGGGTPGPAPDSAGDAASDLIAGMSNTAVAPEVIQELSALTAAELDDLKELYISVKQHKKINIHGIDDMVKGFIRGFRQELNPLSILASLKSAHEYTFTHVTNVCILSMGLAESLGFRGEHLHQIGVSSLLHDVGKMFIPEEILSKPGKLSHEERAVIETHTVKGARYLLGIEGIPKLAVLSALEHHLKYDGTGYPSIKGGWTPNIASQIISIADVFDAMRSKRSYQKNIEMSKIEELLVKESGKAYNPQLVVYFMKMVKR